MQSPTSDAPVLAAPLLSVAHAHAWADLAAVFEPWCNIVHLRRSLPAALAAEAARLGAACWSELRVTLAADTEEGPLAAAPLHAALLARGVPGQDALAADLLVLAEVLRDLTGAEAIGVRLSRLDRPACPRLHYDRVGLRLVTTYLGPGTEYVPDRWSRDGSGASENLGERAALDLRREPRCTSATGDALLLKGTLWPGNAHSGAVRRSPPSAAPSIRLLATFDPI